MNIDQLVLAVKICHIAKVSLFTHGFQGLGKSAAIKQYIGNHFHFGTEIPYGCVDFRAAQMEAADIRGLPEKDEENKRVVYFVPNELPRGEWISSKGNVSGEPGDPKPKDTKDEKWVQHRGILFADEINRAEDDVLNAWFQLVYDREVGEYKLPTGWGIVAAGNPSGGQFTVNSFIDDAAFKDRWCHVFVDVDDDYKRGWANYMSELDIPSDIATNIVQFCMLDDDHLYRGGGDQDDFVITPSPRTWELVSRIEIAIRSLESEVEDETLTNIRYQLMRGLMGDIAGRYIECNIQILPQEIIEDGLNEHRKNILKKFARGQLQALSWGIAGQAKKIEEPTQRQMNNVIKFGKWMMTAEDSNRDLAVAFFDIILQKDQTQRVRRLSFSNPSLQKLMKNLGQSKGWYAEIQDDEELTELLKLTHRGELTEKASDV